MIEFDDDLNVLDQKVQAFNHIKNNRITEFKIVDQWVDDHCDCFLVDLTIGDHVFRAEFFWTSREGVGMVWKSSQKVDDNNETELRNLLFNG